MAIYRTRTDDERQQPPSGTVIEWDDTARVFEAWATPSEHVRSYLGAWDDYDAALSACRGYADTAAKCAKDCPAEPGGTCAVCDE